MQLRKQIRNRGIFSIFSKTLSICFYKNQTIMKSQKTCYLQASGEKICLEIHCNPEEDLKRVTEVFYMVDKSRSRVKGSVGLGLALCQKIADIHGFQLEFTEQLQLAEDLVQ